MYSTSGYNGSACSLRSQAELCHFGFVTALLKLVFHILKMVEKMKLICINFLAHTKGLKLFTIIICHPSIYSFTQSPSIYPSFSLPPSFLSSFLPYTYLPIHPSIHPSIHHPLLHASLAWCSMPDRGDYKNKEDITPDSVEIPV